MVDPTGCVEPRPLVHEKVQEKYGILILHQKKDKECERHAKRVEEVDLQNTM